MDERSGSASCSHSTCRPVPLSCYSYSPGDSTISSALFHKWMFCLGIQPKFFVCVAFFFVLFCGKVSTITYSTAVLELQSEEVVSQGHVSLSPAAFPLLLLLLKPGFYQHFINEYMYCLPSFLQSLTCAFVTITHWQFVLTSVFRSCPAARTQPIFISTAHFKN